MLVSAYIGGHVNTIVKEAPAGRRRRRHSAQFKAEVVRACRQPGVSMAAVALANGLNANVLRRWVQQAEPDRPVGSEVIEAAGAVTNAEGAPAFVPLALRACEPEAEIRIEVRRGATSIKVTWPASVAAECASWMRELLR
jgi:transposase